jgi:hypothetical protein
MPAKFPAVHPATLASLEQQVGLGCLQNNLRTADEIADNQLAALFSLEYVGSFLANIGIKGAALGRLRNALSDVHQGHERSLFKPRRSGKPPRTFRQWRIQVQSAVLMQLRRDDGENEQAAAKAVEKVLDKAGFRLSEGGKRQKATATTVINWRKELTSKKGLTAKTANLEEAKKKREWASNLYRGLLKQLRPHSALYVMRWAQEPLSTARKRAIKAAESTLKGAIADASES